MSSSLNLKKAFLLFLCSFFYLLGRSQWTNTSPDINNTNTGNVGIGITTPQSKLHVFGQISATNYDPQNNLISFVELWSDNALIWQGGAGTAFRFGSASNLGAAGFQEWMRFTDAGNLLIGQATQANISYKLDVAGNVRANKIVVNTTGADFVFDSNYHVLPLPKVEAFINAYHHLPDIQPAGEMRKNGLDIGQQSDLLLQKIEELTLYLIKQNKEIDSLKDESRTLREQDERLKQQDLKFQVLIRELKMQEERINRLEKKKEDI
jgi:hypothetical protein